ncbi:MAG: cupin domain-containing protein [Massiliimalia sp.]
MSSKNERTVERVENMAGGKGHVLIERLLDEQQLNGKCGLYAKVTIEPGCTLGYHEHHGETETYYILSGEGSYNDNHEANIPVAAGDVTFCPDGKGHGLDNTGDTDLVFMALIIKS